MAMLSSSGQASAAPALDLCGQQEEPREPFLADTNLPKTA